MDTVVYYDVKPLRSLDGGITILYLDPSNKAKIIELISKYGVIANITLEQIPEAFQNSNGGFTFYMSNEDDSYTAIDQLWKTRKPFGTLLLGLEPSMDNYYQLSDLIWGVDHLDEDSDDSSDITGSSSVISNKDTEAWNPESESEESEEGFQYWIPVKTPIQTIQKDRNSRLHFQVPFTWTCYNTAKTLSRFGPIDYIKFIPMSKVPGFTGIVKFHYCEDAEFAFHHCDRKLKPVYAEPRFGETRLSFQEKYKIHQQCGLYVTRSEFDNHERICDTQFGCNYKLHWFCGRAVQLKEWSNHLKSFDPYKY